MDEIKIGQIISYRNPLKNEISTGKVVCISQVQDCLYEQYIGKTLFDVKEEEYSSTTKVWIDDVIKTKEGKKE